MLIDSVPRFSTFLQRIAGESVDWDALELKRRQSFLQCGDKHKESQGSRVRSAFLAEIFFSDRVPSDAKKAFDRWLKLCAEVADGDMVSSDELHAFAQAAW